MQSKRIIWESNRSLIAVIPAGRANLKSEKHQERQNFGLRASKMRGYYNWIVGLMTIGMTGWWGNQLVIITIIIIMMMTTKKTTTAKTSATLVEVETHDRIKSGDDRPRDNLPEDGLARIKWSARNHHQSARRQSQSHRDQYKLAEASTVNIALTHTHSPERTGLVGLIIEMCVRVCELMSNWNADWSTGPTTCDERRHSPSLSLTS